MTMPPPAAASPAASSADTDAVSFQGTVVKVNFRRADTNWTAARVEPAQPLQPPLGDGHHVAVVAVAGTWPSCAQGLPFLIHGRAEHGKYGWQVAIDDERPPTLVQPSDRDGLVRLLAQESVTHFGPVVARRVVDHFGDDVLRVLEEEPERLAEVKGISLDYARAAGEAWQALKAAQVSPSVLKRLYRIGLTKWQVSRITARFGERAADVVFGDPYELVQVDGIGFATADGIAARLKNGAGERLIPPDDPRRVRAAVLHVLEDLTRDGHTLAPGDVVERLVACEWAGGKNDEQLKTKKKGLAISVPTRVIYGEIDRLVADELLVSPYGTDDFFLALPKIRSAEEDVARRLVALEAGDPPAFEERWDDLTEGLVARQADAVHAAREHGVLVITGGPGTGKTHTLRRIVDGFQRAHFPVYLAAPTGKAARRMEEAVPGVEAKTIHRLLYYTPGVGFAWNEEMPLPAGAIVVDESSMMDVALARALLAALVPGQHRLILVGDVDQLPSVGPGAVLRDIIESGRVPVVRLVEVMRQAAGSLIVTGAHAINCGERPDFGPWADRSVDLKWKVYDDDADAAIAADLLKIVARMLPGRALPRGGVVDPIRDVQVLCPMKRGSIGTQALGRALAEALNPAAAGRPFVEVGGGTRGETKVIREGDRVIQTKNAYQLNNGQGVFNGETGIVAAVRPGAGLTVDFGDPGRPVCVDYELRQARDLELAYALTIHKSQGSEWPIVVVPVHSQHAHMWSRQLLYTAITRARQWCVLLGTEKALALAIRKDQGVSRWTALREMLRAAE